MCRKVRHREAYLRPARSVVTLQPMLCIGCSSGEAVDGMKSFSGSRPFIPYRLSYFASTCLPFRCVVCRTLFLSKVLHRMAFCTRRGHRCLPPLLPLHLRRA